jgi:hypothetical protein
VGIERIVQRGYWRADPDGSVSVANYQLALRRITYVNASENPSTVNRVVTFSVSDGAQSVSATRTVSLTAVNDPPTAADNSYAVNQGSTLSATDTTGSTGSTNDDSVLRNDTDPENNTLSATIVDGPTHASSFTLNSDGTFTYTHNGDAATSDSFTYFASDSTDPSNIATVTITITSPEVMVLGNGVSITNGDVTPGATDFTDFGNVTQGGLPVSRSFTVRNDGSGALNLSGLVVPAGFTITDPLVASLAAGASDTLTVRLDTATSGTKSGQISFTTTPTRIRSTSVSRNGDARRFDHNRLSSGWSQRLPGDDRLRIHSDNPISNERANIAEDARQRTARR